MTTKFDVTWIFVRAKFVTIYNWRCFGVVNNTKNCFFSLGRWWQIFRRWGNFFPAMSPVHLISHETIMKPLHNQEQTFVKNRILFSYKFFHYFKCSAIFHFIIFSRKVHFTFFHDIVIVTLFFTKVMWIQLHFNKILT